MDRRRLPEKALQYIRILEADLNVSGVLSAAFRRSVVKSVQTCLERCMPELENVQLWRFMSDEMSKEINIVKLRKLALCRLGDSRYADYRMRYFDGKAPA